MMVLTSVAHRQAPHRASVFCFSQVYRIFRHVARTVGQAAEHWATVDAHLSKPLNAEHDQGQEAEVEDD